MSPARTAARALAVTAAAVALTACAHAPRTTAHPNPNPPAAAPAVSDPAPQDTPTPTSRAELPLGTGVTVTEEGDDTGTVTIAAGRPMLTTAALSDYGQKPARRYYATFTLTAQCTSSGHTLNLNPFDFYVRNSDGDRFGYSDGNMAGLDSQVNDATLGQGEKLRGTLTFDVPMRHGELVYAPNADGGTLATWVF